MLAPAPDTPLARRPMDAARPFEAARAHVAVMAPRNVVPLPVAAAEAEAEAVEYDTGELTAAAASAAARRAERARARVDVLRRRQQVLSGLMAATVVSLVAAFLLGRLRAWAAHLSSSWSSPPTCPGSGACSAWPSSAGSRSATFPAAAAATAPSAGRLEPSERRRRHSLGRAA